MDLPFSVFTERKGSSSLSLFKDCNGKTWCCSRQCLCACPLETRAHTDCFIQLGDAGQVTGPFLQVVWDLHGELLLI